MNSELKFVVIDNNKDRNLSTCHALLPIAEAIGILDIDHMQAVMKRYHTIHAVFLDSGLDHLEITASTIRKYLPKTSIFVIGDSIPMNSWHHWSKIGVEDFLPYPVKTDRISNFYRFQNLEQAPEQPVKRSIQSVMDRQSNDNDTIYSSDEMNDDMQKINKKPSFGTKKVKDIKIDANPSKSITDTSHHKDIARSMDDHSDDFSENKANADESENDDFFVDDSSTNTSTDDDFFADESDVNESDEDDLFADESDVNESDDDESDEDVVSVDESDEDGFFDPSDFDLDDDSIKDDNDFFTESPSNPNKNERQKSKSIAHDESDTEENGDELFDDETYDQLGELFDDSDDNDNDDNDNDDNDNDDNDNVDNDNVDNDNDDNDSDNDTEEDDEEEEDILSLFDSDSESLSNEKSKHDKVVSALKKNNHIVDYTPQLSEEEDESSFEFAELSEDEIDNEMRPLNRKERNQKKNRVKKEKPIKNEKMKSIEKVDYGIKKLGFFQRIFGKSKNAYLPSITNNISTKDNKPSRKTSELNSKSQMSAMSGNFAEDRKRQIIEQGDGAPRSCKIVTFSSSGGGDGKTTIGANVAVYCASMGYRTLFIDADLNGGAPGMFHISPQYAIGDIEKNQQKKDISLFERLVTVHESGLHILSNPPKRFSIVKTTHIEQVIETAKPWYDVIIIDIAGGLDALLKVAFSVSTHAVTVSTGQRDRLDRLNSFIVKKLNHKVTQLDWQFIINKRRNQEDEIAVLEVLNETGVYKFNASKNERQQIRIGGIFPSDRKIETAVDRLKLPIEVYPNSPFSKAIKKWVAQELGISKSSRRKIPTKSKKK